MSLGANGTVGAGQFSSEISFRTSLLPQAHGRIYVAFTTSLAGSATVPSIVGFDNLYSTQPAAGGFCSNAGPSVKWAYNTNPAGDTTGTTLTSPALSLDGTKIAFVESRANANGGSILHILKWKPGAGVAVQGTNRRIQQHRIRSWRPAWLGTQPIAGGQFLHRGYNF